ncbi:hypothetical protein Pa4123_13040 [Phytohabitans aurantiacus]|uniref:Uncharacterized protein n=1 Tax=Phytohabitans aurantiacus TaxID=3016789 RepID=A0ABQ5QQ60_9ACTN|nr:hypothetical protein Pa4123_13040 [Phytohabitans aurantiacus]
MMPNVAASETTFMTTALTGTTREPVIRNSSTSIARAVSPMAIGRRPVSRPVRSRRSAASPVTHDRSPGGRSSRIRSTRSHTVPPCGSPRTSNSTMDISGDSGAAGRTRATSGSGRQRDAHSSSARGDVEASTVTLATGGRPNRRTSASATSTPSIDRGRLSTVSRRTEVGSAGAVAASSTADVARATSSGRRCTRPARRAKKPASAPLSGGRIRRAPCRAGRIHLRSRPSRPAVRVRDASIATTAMDMPAMPRADSPGTPNVSIPTSDVATVRALNRMVRPAVAQVRSRAASGGPGTLSSSRYRLTSSSE